ncbi:MAG: glutamate--tRNA ligase [Pirellulaceae bacterium]|nr:glutamate--tRNA ligase [Pirellulaceae bacterium]
MKVRTRFAPSPTGYLHIGGVRTALFNWLFARHHGGQFILRIDDTDQQRNVEAALQPILDGFRWLGLDWDEGPGIEGPFAPYFQSKRSDRYREAVTQLIASGAAYHDYANPEEIQAEREAAEKEKRPFSYSRTWMAETDAQRSQFESEGRQPVVRLKMPRAGELTIPDIIRGDVTFEWSREQDHVIQRKDGTCLYHLATVVDDADFEITHVIRAEEHLSNTPRQIFIAQSLGLSLPTFAHVPYVAEPGSRTKLSKRKLSKYLKNRDFATLNNLGLNIAQKTGFTPEADTFNPVIVDFYEQVGFLADAVVNYLLLLGWSLDDRTEFFSRAEMIEQFSLERVNKSPASFDCQKLMAFEKHYLQELPIKQKVTLVLPFLQKANWVSTPPPCGISEKLQKIVTAAGDRITIAGDILEFSEFFSDDHRFEYDEKAYAKRLTKAPESVELLQQFTEILRNANSFAATDLEKLLKDFVADRNVKIGQIIHALRVAVTGKAVGFGMFETLEILGKDSSILRIDRTLQKLNEQTD